jgi:DNA polymerase III delta prime subunit
VKIAGFVLHPASSDLLDTTLSEPSHAILLTGPVGIGKSHIGIYLAAQLLGAPTIEALDNHAYYRSVSPDKTTITIEQVRELVTFFRLKVPGKAAVQRVAIMQEAEKMSREAQNALLKLLEEPPEGSVLLLASSQPDQLLPTIRSRLQTILLRAPDQAAIIAHFAAAGYDEALVNRVLLRTGTNISEAARLLSLGSDSPDEPLQLVKQVLTGSSYDRMLLVDGLSKQKEQAMLFVATLAATAMASLQAAAAKNPSGITRWQSVLHAADTASAALEQSGNVKLVLTELMLAL